MMAHRELRLPWAYTRAKLAEAWYCKPWDVDAAPEVEILTQLKLWGIESQMRQRG